MDKLWLLSLIGLFTIGCAGSPRNVEIRSAPEPTAVATTTASSPFTPSPTTLEPGSLQVSASSDNRYTSEQFGFEFNYPTGYEIVDQESSPSGGYISVMRQEDIGTPEPLSISITIHANPDQLTLEDFRMQEIQPLIEQEHPHTLVADQPALDFESTGLYEMRNLVYSTPDGRYVIHVNTTYLQAPSDNDPLWQATKAIISSFQWLN